MKVISETRGAHLSLYLRFHYRSKIVFFFFFGISELLKTSNDYDCWVILMDSKLVQSIGLRVRLRLWYLTPLSTIFQLYHGGKDLYSSTIQILDGGQLYWWRKPEYQEKTTHRFTCLSRSIIFEIFFFFFFFSVYIKDTICDFRDISINLLVLG